ncbi:MAG: TonB-dependent receptor [Bacteroidota bacterium]|nr:TonB-dependent receptor [Bacteroidota bacterium]MDE2833939.1 TonB-dependent receptor [Bacteroidota bacterium]
MILRLILCALLVGSASAQVPSDTLTHYTMEEIVISADGAVERSRSASTVHRVALAGIAQTDAASIDQVLRLIPAARVQTNSRGESLVYIRGSGERQISLFFDGALLNVPWDNRVDLSLIPSEVVGDITVAKGVPSVLYGPNVLGGAIDMASRELRAPGAYLQLSGITGSYGTSQSRLTWLRRGNRFRTTVFGGLSRSDGTGIPGDAVLPYSQTEGSLRTNTDRDMHSVFAQGAFESESGVSVGLSLLRFGGRKGVAPEGHLDPARARVRYWRYPDWATNMVIISSQVPLGTGNVRGAMWVSRFGQRIDKFEDHSYRSQVESQEDEDDTFGIRMTFMQPAGAIGRLRGAFSMLASEHWQQNKGGGGIGAPLEFVQRVYSGGVEYVREGAVEVSFGASGDVLTTPRTGDKPPRPSQSALGITTGATYTRRSGVALRASVGRKVRFPTMRELFGEALGRFLVNPALRPESSILSELGLHVEGGSIDFETIVFFTRTYDTIGQHMVVLPGDSRALRQRINLEGSRMGGLELVLASRLSPSLRGNCNLTWMHVRALENGRTVPLAEKPNLLGGCNLGYTLKPGLAITAESFITGQAHGLATNNQFVTLPASAILNARVSWLLLLNQVVLEVFGRVNNLTDDTELPQLGLPGPGREVYLGVQVSF